MLGDRINRRKLFCVLQCACILHSGTLAALTLTGHLTAHLLIGLASLRGMVNAAELPTRQTLMVELVGDRANLPNAIALNSSLFNVARLVGPGLAGLAIMKIGAGWCYAIDACSGVPVVLIMLGIRDGGSGIISKARSNPFIAVREGVRYVAADIRLRAPLIIIGVISLAGFAGVTLAPLIAIELLHGDARTLGLIHTSVGVGALCSAVFLGMRRSHLGLEKWIRFGALGVVGGPSVVGFCSLEATTLAGMAVCGMGTVLVFAGGNTLLQARVDDDKRGRVMGLFAMSQSMYPIGGLIIGTLAASVIGPRITMLVTASVCLGGSIWFRRRAMTPGAASNPKAGAEEDYPSPRISPQGPTPPRYP